MYLILIALSTRHDLCAFMRLLYIYFQRITLKSLCIGRVFVMYVSCNEVFFWVYVEDMTSQLGLIAKLFWVLVFYSYMLKFRWCDYERRRIVRVPFLCTKALVHRVVYRFTGYWRKCVYAHCGSSTSRNSCCKWERNESFFWVSSLGGCRCSWFV